MSAAIRAEARGRLTLSSPIAWENLPNHWNLTLFYTLWIVVELVFVYFFYVETKGEFPDTHPDLLLSGSGRTDFCFSHTGPTLEEIAKIFDGEDAVAHVDMRTVEKEIEHGQVETVGDHAEV